MTKLWLWDDPGPDRGWSWVVALGACSITFCSYGFSRSCGVLFVATVETFGVSRQEASWPFNLAIAVACFSGIVAGFLTRFLSIRQTVLIASGLCFSGIALCTFATSTVWLVVCYGVIYGLGIAMCFPVMLAILNQYFIRHRATANGIYLSGATLGLFAFPPLLEYFISNYGLRGTMLLQAGLVMHMFVGASLLRSRTPENFPILAHRLKDAHDPEVNTELLKNGCGTQMLHTDADATSFNGEFQTKEKGVPDDNDFHEERNKEVDDLILNKLGREEHIILSRRSSKTSLPKEVSLSRRDTVSSIFAKSSIRASITGSCMLGLDTLGAMSREDLSQKLKTKDAKQTYLSIVKDIFLDPCYYMVVVSGAACFLPLFTFMVTIMDFGMDRGLPREKAVLIMSAISIPELMGRFCFGWISDRGYLKYKTLFMISKSIGGVLLFLMPSFGYDAGIYVISGFFGAAESCAVTILNVLFVEYLGLERLPIAFSWSVFFDGFLFLGMPYVIGLFRDSFGSYDYLFYLLGSLNVLSVLVWFMEPAILRRKAKTADTLAEKKDPTNSEPVRTA